MSEDANKPVITKISAVGWDKSMQRWYVRYRVDGNPTCRRFRSKEKAQEHRQSLMAQLPGAPPPPKPKRTRRSKSTHEFPAYDGTATWWDQQHGWLALELLAAVRDRDDAKIDALKGACNAFASIARSQRDQRDTKELERHLKTFQQRWREIGQAQGQGTRIVA